MESIHHVGCTNPFLRKKEKYTLQFQIISSMASINYSNHFLLTHCIFRALISYFGNYCYVSIQYHSYSLSPITSGWLPKSPTKTQRQIIGHTDLDFHVFQTLCFAQRFFVGNVTKKKITSHGELTHQTDCKNNRLCCC